MTDTLDTALDALGRVPSPLRWSDVTTRSPAPEEPTSAAPRGGPRHPLVAAAAAIVVLLAAVAAVVLVTADDGDRVHTEPGPGTTAPPTTTTTTTEVPPTTALPPASTPAGLGVRDRGAVTAVSDDAYLVWGGAGRVDGFAVDLETGSVTEIPDAPISDADTGDGAWIGSELVVWSTTVEEAAAWSPAERRWRTIAAPPIQIRATPATAVAAGDRIVVVATGGSASYDPEADVWTTIPGVPDLPGQGPAVDLVWTGGEVVAWATEDFGGPYAPPGEDDIADLGWRWAPGDAEWSRLPDLPPGSRTSSASMVWTGAEVMVWGLSTSGDDGGLPVGTGALWRPGDAEWTPVAPSPQGRAGGFEGMQGSQTLAADPIDRRVLVHPLDLDGGFGERDTYLYDPGTDTWTVADVSLEGVFTPVTFHAGLVLRPDPTSPTIGPP